MWMKRGWRCPSIYLSAPHLDMDTAAIIFATTVVITAVDKLIERFYPNSRVNNIIDLILRFLGTVPPSGKL